MTLRVWRSFPLGLTAYAAPRNHDARRRGHEASGNTRQAWPIRCAQKRTRTQAQPVHYCKTALRPIIDVLLPHLGVHHASCFARHVRVDWTGGLFQRHAARRSPRPRPATPRRRPPPRSHAFSPDVTAADYAEFTRVLASDELEGRGPGSPGETKTIEYLIQHYQRMGFEPGNNGSWIQTVPMVTTTTQPGASLTLTVDGQPHALEFGTQMVLGTRNGAARNRHQGQQRGVRRLRRQCTRTGLERLRRSGCERQDGGDVHQRPGLPHRRRKPVRRPSHDLLRAMDLQVRGSSASGCEPPP
jgi:hypothetical protein